MQALYRDSCDYADCDYADYADSPLRYYQACNPAASP